MFHSILFNLTVEPTKSIVMDDLEDVEVNLVEIKSMLQYLMEVAPRGAFHNAVDRTLQGAYWLHSAVKNLDHNTGYAMQVALDNFFDEQP